MTALQNFTFGSFVAIVLMGPSVWAGAQEAVTHTESLVIALLTGPAQSSVEAARTTVRSAILPKS
jgi:hypothetical protein